jgi:biopolymer transport protein ExbD
MKINPNTAESDIRIEIVPLIDVIFCILIFFILAALQITRQQAINVDLPKAQTGQPQLQPEMMVVSVDFIGQTYIDQQPVTRAQLTASLKAFSQKNPQGSVALYGAKTASYNDVIQVLDLLRSIAGDRVALATIPTSSTQAAGSDSVSPPESGQPGWSLPGRSGGNSTNPGLTAPGDPAQLSPALPDLPNQSGNVPAPGNLPSQPSTGTSPLTKPAPQSTGSR